LSATPATSRHEPRQEPSDPDACFGFVINENGRRREYPRGTEDEYLTDDESDRR
jgi:hypothetical protein